MNSRNFDAWWTKEWKGKPNETIRRVAFYAYSGGEMQVINDICGLIEERARAEVIRVSELSFVKEVVGEIKNRYGLEL